MVHFIAAVDLASPVQEEDLEGRHGRPAGWARQLTGEDEMDEVG